MTVDRLPRGRHAPPPEVVRESQRGRMLAAVASAVAEKGYARFAVADVIARAGVSRKTFYEHFANKEECFLAAYDAGADALLASIDEAVRAAAPDWFAGARTGAERYLETLAAMPDFARTFLIEALAAGPAAVARRNGVHQRFADLLAAAHAAAREHLPELPAVEPWVFRACVGAVHELVTDRLIREGATGLPELADQINELEQDLLVGNERARLLQERR